MLKLIIESPFSLSYECHADRESDLKFRLNHNDFPNKFRIVVFDPKLLSEQFDPVENMSGTASFVATFSVFSAKQTLVRGLVTMFNQGWTRDFLNYSRQSTTIYFTLNKPSQPVDSGSSEEIRQSELASLRVTLSLRSSSRETPFNIRKSTI